MPREAGGFGKALRGLWHLAPEATFLNHGSFGAVPREVFAEQERLRLAMESQPDRFFRDRIMPREGVTPLREAIGALEAFVGARPGSLALVENATLGAQAALRSITFAPGDEILITDHTYNAVRLMVEARCAETGANMRTVALPLPATADAMVEHFAAAMSPAVRLAIVDHITSPTALALPLDRIVPLLQGGGAKVLVDGAHAVGHLPLDLEALGADWYTSNAHKWLFTPRGTAFLHASPQAAAMTQAPVVSHFVGLGFPASFDYVGTRDYSAWLALPAALRFWHSLGANEARAYRRALIDKATVAMARIGAQPIADEGLGCSMRAFRLPQSRAATIEDVDALVRPLWERHRIQSMAVAFGGALLLRISAQAYVDEDDIAALVSTLERDGWPGASERGAVRAFAGTTMR